MVSPYSGNGTLKCAVPFNNQSSAKTILLSFPIWCAESPSMVGRPDSVDTTARGFFNQQFANRILAFEIFLWIKAVPVLEYVHETRNGLLASPVSLQLAPELCLGNQFATRLFDAA